MDITKLTKLELKIFDHVISARTNTKNRMMSIIVLSSIVAFTLIWAYFNFSAKQIMQISLLYIGITTLEKLSYGNAVIGYKGLITKLNNELEKNNCEI